MSINAYRVVKIEHAIPSSFSLWHDDKLMEFLDGEYDFWNMLDANNHGIADLPVSALGRAIKEVPMDEETKAVLQKDIDACRKAGEDSIQYYCY